MTYNLWVYSPALAVHNCRSSAPRQRTFAPKTGDSAFVHSTGWTKLNGAARFGVPRLGQYGVRACTTKKHYSISQHNAQRTTCSHRHKSCWANFLTWSPFATSQVCLKTTMKQVAMERGTATNPFYYKCRPAVSHNIKYNFRTAIPFPQVRIETNFWNLENSSNKHIRDVWTLLHCISFNIIISIHVC